MGRPKNPKPRKYSEEFIQSQARRSIDDQYRHLPLSRLTITIRLPEAYHDEARLRGQGWLRNLVCNEIDNIRKVTNDTV